MSATIAQDGAASAAACQPVGRSDWWAGSLPDSAGDPAPVSTAGKPVQFHRLRDSFGDFTNFSRHPVVIDGLRWPTGEHYFQAAKFTDARYAVLIREAGTPSRAAVMGRTRTVAIRADWESARVQIMRRVLYSKFLQHPKLAELLLSTGHQPLVETTARDRFWGNGSDGTGRNMTGLLLQEVREHLRSHNQNADQLAQTAQIQRIVQTIAPAGPTMDRPRWARLGPAVVPLPAPARGGSLAWQAYTTVTAAAAISADALGPDRVVSAMAGEQFWWVLRLEGHRQVLVPANHPPQRVSPLDPQHLSGQLAAAAGQPICVHDARWAVRA